MSIYETEAELQEKLRQEKITNPNMMYFLKVIENWISWIVFKFDI